MFDARIRPFIDVPINAVGRLLARAGVSANAITGGGFLLALVMFLCLAFANYWLALIFMGLNRLMDGLDGAVARMTRVGAAGNATRTGESDFGAYIDTVSDFLFYGGTVFFFAVGRPMYALHAAFLIFSFVGSGSSFLAYAILATKRGLVQNPRVQKSYFYASGLMEGSETIAFFVLMCLFPSWFPWIASIFGTLCFVTVAGRLLQARADFA